MSKGQKPRAPRRSASAPPVPPSRGPTFSRLTIGVGTLAPPTNAIWTTIREPPAPAPATRRALQILHRMCDVLRESEVRLEVRHVVTKGALGRLVVRTLTCAIGLATIQEHQSLLLGAWAKHNPEPPRARPAPHNRPEMEQDEAHLEAHRREIPAILLVVLHSLIQDDKQSRAARAAAGTAAGLLFLAAVLGMGDSSVAYRIATSIAEAPDLDLRTRSFLHSTLDGDLSLRPRRERQRAVRQVRRCLSAALHLHARSQRNAERPRVRIEVTRARSGTKNQSHVFIINGVQIGLGEGHARVLTALVRAHDHAPQIVDPLPSTSKTRRTWLTRLAELRRLANIPNRVRKVLAGLGAPLVHPNEPRLNDEELDIEVILP